MLSEGSGGKTASLDDARRFIDEGKWPDAMWALDSYIKSVNPDDPGTVHELLEAHRMRGLALARMSRFKESVSDYMKAIELSKKLGDRRAETLCLEGLGRVHWDMGDNKMADEFYKESLTVAREIGDRPFEAAAQIGLANVHNSEGELEEAVMKYQEAIDILAALGPSMQLARAYTNIGDSLIKLGRLDEAIECLEGAVDVSNEIGHLVARGFGNTFLAICYARKGDLDLAMQFIDKAIGDLGAAHDKMGFIQAIATLGMIHGKAGRYDMALTEIGKADEMAMKSNLDGLRGEVLVEKARVLAAMGDAEKARVVYQEAIGIFTLLGNDSEVSDLEMEIARLHRTGS